MFLACKVEETHKKLPLIVTATIGALDKTPEGSQRFAERSYRTDERHPVSPDANRDTRLSEKSARAHLACPVRGFALLQDHAKWRERILSGEEAMLEALCFDLIVAHPHEVLVTCADQLNVGRPLTRVAWTVLNDWYASTFRLASLSRYVLIRSHTFMLLPA